MKQLSTALLFAVCMFGLVFSRQTLAQKQDFGKTVHVGLISDAYSDVPYPLAESVEEEIRTLLDSEYKIAIDDEHVLHSNWDILQAEAHYQRLIADPKVEIIIALGILSSDAVSRKSPYLKPVIASVVFDAKLQQLPMTDKGSSGIRNFNYIISPYNPRRDLEVFHELHPFRNVALLLGDNIMQGLASMNAYFESTCRELGVTCTEINVGQIAETALREIPSAVDAVYFGPLFYLKDPSQIDLLIEGINQRKLPSFALQGVDAVEMGIMASIAPRSNFTRLSRRVALNLEQILEGKDAGDLTVSMNFKEALTINMETARNIGFAPSFDKAAQATLLNDELKTVDRSLNLIAAIHEALDNNWDVTIANKDVRIAAQDVNQARSNYFPQADASTTGLMIDADRAEASFGAQSEFSATASGTASQLLFSEDVNASIKVQRKQLESIEYAKDATEMDVVLQVAEAYMNVLRAKTAVATLEENLRLTRKNLELAKVRQTVGYSGPSDLYRWQSEIALAKSNLLESKATQRIAEIALNEIVGFRIDDDYRTEEVRIEDNYLITNDDRLFQYIDNEIVYRYYADFMVTEAMNNLPELKQLQSIVDLQDRVVSQRRRSFFLPTIGVQGGADYLYWQDGAGSEPPSDPIIPGLPQVDELNWNVGMNASVPILTGGRRLNQLQQSKVQLLQIKDQQVRLKRRLEQRVRNNIELIAVSYTNIGLSREAEEAARKNFELVQDAYSNGLVSIIQLIDAQNAAIQADQFSTNAVYEFVIDLLNIERSVGFFYSLATDETRNNYFDRLNDFVINNKDNN